MNTLPAAKIRFSAERDLWAAIVDVSTVLFTKHKLRIFLFHHDKIDVTECETPQLKLWRMLEILSVLTVLEQADSIRSKEIRGIAERSKPIEYKTQRGIRFLWTQPKMVGSISGLIGRPDIVINDSSDSITQGNIERVIECKRVKRLGAIAVRSEFAKGYDLGVDIYHIWSFYRPSNKVIAGAKALGINIGHIGFEKGEREGRLDPEALWQRMSEEQRQADLELRFAGTRERVAVEEQEKRRRLDHTTR
jgi:hypothetical protein